MQNDYTKIKYEIDELQLQMINRYLQDDINFRRAFYTDYTPFFFQYIQDKIKQKVAYISAKLGSEWTRTETEEIAILADMIKNGTLK